ncbi:MAG: diguanylate cyclase [Oscillospiraceae bacterium]|nr:diguanylate cyclase [Oscillospiraceae bacterium]
MKKLSGLTAKILKMAALTAVLICVCITAAGAVLIYITTEEGIKNEVNYAAHSLNSLLDSEFYGEYYLKNGSLYKGGTMISRMDFMATVSSISCSDDVDFTVFWGDTRVFTTVKRSDGSYITGTSAEKKVTDSVLGKGIEYYYSRVKINGRYYAGYYIPIMDTSAKTVGMVFAGRPLDAARSNMRKIITCFTIISAAVLAVNLAVFSKFSSKIVGALLEVKSFMENVANGDFAADLSLKTLSLTDEVGDIARSADTLRYNLRDLVERDPLTTLLNRRSCRKAIDKLLEQNKGYTAAMADIDHFKSINDGFGHACGDMVLKELSAMIKEETEKKKGFVSRWGGEEFLIILPGSGLNESKKFLEQILEMVRSAEYVWEGKRIPVTITIGAAEMINGEIPDETINRADHLLYDGKESGRNRLVT